MDGDSLSKLISSRSSSRKSIEEIYGARKSIEEICRARGLPVEEPVEETTPILKPKLFYKLPKIKAEIFKCLSESSEEQPEEASEESSQRSTPEIFTIDDIFKELKGMTLRINFLDKQLGLNVPECPEKRNEHQESIGTTAFPEIQKSSHKLDQQQAEFRLNRKGSDMATKYLRNAVCRQSQFVNEIQGRMQQIESFQLTLQREQALCVQRHRFLELKFASGCDESTNLMAYLSKLVEPEEYRDTTSRSHKVIQFLKLGSRNIFDRLTSTLAQIDEHLTLSRNSVSFVKNNKKLSVLDPPIGTQIPL
ncbi:hypothetical protein KR009_011126 [Drosophila setifemur]|nr:hypothetical protein KR009_011126 [Drosophila setifemur]